MQVRHCVRWSRAAKCGVSPMPAAMPEAGTKAQDCRHVHAHATTQAPPSSLSGGIPSPTPKTFKDVQGRQYRIPTRRKPTRGHPRTMLGGTALPAGPRTPPSPPRPAAVSLAHHEHTAACTSFSILPAHRYDACLTLPHSHTPPIPRYPLVRRLPNRG